MTTNILSNTDIASDKVIVIGDTPSSEYTREQNLSIITNNSLTVKDAVTTVMELRVELGNLFPTETYGIGCGGTCGRYGCVGNCIIDAWHRYFYNKLNNK